MRVGVPVPHVFRNILIARRKKWRAEFGPLLRRQKKAPFSPLQGLQGERIETFSRAQGGIWYKDDSLESVSHIVNSGHTGIIHDAQTR